MAFAPPRRPTFRLATSEDAGAIAGLVRRAYSPWIGLIGRDSKARPKRSLHARGVRIEHRDDPPAHRRAVAVAFNGRAIGADQLVEP